MFPLNCIPEILCAESIDTELIICANSFPLYDPTLIHNTSVTNRQSDGWTDERRQWCHRCLQHSCNHKSASKIVYSIGLIINVSERKFHANFDVENESSRERKFQGTKVSLMELSFPETKVLGYESSSNP